VWLSTTWKGQTMKRDTYAGYVSTTRSATPKLLRLEREARRLRAEHAGDPLARLVIEIDFRMRDFAHRVAARLLSPGSRRT